MLLSESQISGISGFRRWLLRGKKSA